MIKIIALKIPKNEKEVGDIITVREGTHNWTPTEKSHIGTLFVEIIVKEDPPNPIGYYKQPLAVLNIRSRDNNPKDLSDGRAIIKRDIILATVPWDGENTFDYHLEKNGIPEKFNHEFVTIKERRFKLDITGITDTVTFNTWAELLAKLTDKQK